MNEEQKKEAEKTIVGEFSSVKHVRGILSMGRCFLLITRAGHCLLTYHLKAFWFCPKINEHLVFFLRT
jgi:hypothetical protein